MLARSLHEPKLKLERVFPLCPIFVLAGTKLLFANILVGSQRPCPALFMVYVCNLKHKLFESDDGESTCDR